MNDATWIIVSVLLSLTSGFIPIETEFSFQRAFVFFPFFILGMIFRKRRKSSDYPPRLRPREPLCAGLKVFYAPIRKAKRNEQKDRPNRKGIQAKDVAAQRLHHAAAQEENKIAPKFRHKEKHRVFIKCVDSVRTEAYIPKAADGEEEEEQHGNKLSMPIRCQPNIENMPEDFPTDSKNAFQNFF